MSTVQYPTDGTILLDGGLSNKFEKSIIQDNESPECLNVVFSDGAVGTREGYSKLNSTPIGSFAVDGLYTRRADDGAETMVAFAGGTAWALVGTSFATIPSAQSVFTADQRVCTTQYENHMFIGNGGVTPYKYDGTEFTRHGVPAATGVVSVASNGVGNLDASADYQYKITFVNSQLAEGDVGTATATFVISSTAGQNRLTDIPVAPGSHGVSARRIYRTEGGGTVFKRLTELSDNTTTTFDDNVADADLGVDAPTDNGEPPIYSVCAYHQNRLWVNDINNPNFLYYSNLAEPYTFASTNFFRVGDASTDVIKGICVFNDLITIYCEKSIWLLHMPDTSPSNWQLVKTKSQYGSKSPFSCFDYNGKQMFAAMQNDKFVGFAALEGQNISPTAALNTVSTAGSFLQSDRIEPDMFQVQISGIENVSSMVYKQKAYITLQFGAATTENNRMYIFDFGISNLSKNQEASWVPWSGMSASQLTIYNGDLYFGSSLADGRIYQLEDGTYNDDGAAIDSFYFTKEFTGLGKHKNNHKDFTKSNILIDLPGDYFMDVNFRNDSDKGDGNLVQIDVDPGGSLWGTMVWGTDAWGGGSNQRKERIFLGNSQGDRIQFKFSNQNTVDQRFKVHWLNFLYNVKGVR